MNLVERYKKPTPKFFKTLRNVGIALATAGGALLAAPIALPAFLVSAGGYMTVAGTVAVSVSQAVVSDVEGTNEKKNENSKGKNDVGL